MQAQVGYSSRLDWIKSHKTVKKQPSIHKS